jgi:signal recognition particle receptor subunit beta
MVLFNYSTKELTAKVVYYGPGLCGKTTNLQWIHEKLPIKNKGKMLSLATETDRTLFFDFLPIEIGTIRGMRTRIQLYTVPGQVFYNATRRMVLKGADCVVFVCDSQEPMLDANLESFENLRQNLEANEIDADEIPIVYQYNKRDLPNALPLEIINERMNTRGQPYFEAVAVKGVGVEETLKGVTKLVFKSLSAKYGEGTGPFPAVAAVKLPTAPPAEASARPKGFTSTLPPSAGRPTVGSPEDLLDELDLEPALELEEAAPPPPSRPNLRTTTLETTPEEAQDLRRRIGMPAELEVSFEEPGTSDGDGDSDVEEITFDEDPLAGLDGYEEPAPPPPNPKPKGPPQAPRAATPPLQAAASSRATPSAGVAVLRATAPTTVTVDVEPGQSEVTVPVQIAMEPGGGPVTLNLKIVLRPRR